MIYNENIKIGNLVYDNQLIVEGYYGDLLVYYNPQYIYSNLTQWYDGIDNTGTGVHNPTATTWTDLTGNNNHGLLQFDAVFDNDCIFFNGYARVRFQGNITPQYTIMTTMSRLRIGAHPRIMGDPKYPSIYFHTNRTAGQGLWSPSFYAPPYDNTFTPAEQPMVDAQRYHIAIRYKGINNPVELFMNGIKVGQTSSNIVPPENVSAAYLGGNNINTGSTRFLTGEMCNYMVYNVPLPDADIKKNFDVDKIRFNII